VWHQPNGSSDLLPFRPEVRDLGQTFLPDPPHGWNDTHTAWNAGRFHCSLMRPTDPNRYHMWTGWVSNDGRAGGPVISNAEAGYD
jgi:phospholipase C